jgi:hypothetical protein
MTNLNRSAPGWTQDYRPLLELSDSGLLWLINRAVFHPRGVALALHEKDGDVLGWSLVTATESEPFSFPESVDNDGFRRAEATLRAALTKEARR